MQLNIKQILMSVTFLIMSQTHASSNTTVTFVNNSDKKINITYTYNNSPVTLTISEHSTAPDFNTNNVIIAEIYYESSCGNSSQKKIGYTLTKNQSDTFIQAGTHITNHTVTFNINPADETIKITTPGLGSTQNQTSNYTPIEYYCTTIVNNSDQDMTITTMGNNSTTISQNQSNIFEKQITQIKYENARKHEQTYNVSSQTIGAYTLYLHTPGGNLTVQDKDNTTTNLIAITLQDTTTP